MSKPQRPEICPVCGRYPDVARFCLRCGALNSHPRSGDRAAPYHYRLAAEALDVLILTLGVLPWLIWMNYTARDGQSPGKRLLGMRILREDGQPVTVQRIWVRELVIKRLIFGLLFFGLFGYVFAALIWIADAAWMMLNPDRQCIHDRMVGTITVINRPLPELSEASSPEPSGKILMPPPAPPAKIPPAPPAAPPDEAPAAPPPPPELAELEHIRERYSQFEYERRRTEIIRRLNQPKDGES